MRTNKKNILPYHIKKAVVKSFAVLFSILLIMSNFSISFADSLPDFVPVAVLGTSVTREQLGEFGTFVPKFTTRADGYFSLDEDTDVYVGCYSSGNNITFVFLSHSPYSSVPYHYGFSTNDTLLSGIWDFSSNSLNNVYYVTISTGATSGNYTTLYSSLNDMTAAFANWTPPIPTPATTYNYTIQNGWLSVIDLGSSDVLYDITLNTSFAEYSHLSQPWWDSTQRYWFTDTIPTVGSTITNSETGTLIPWEKTGSTDLFGRSKTAVAEISGSASSRYLVVYNPAYHKFHGFGTGPRDESNLPLNISGIPQGATVNLFKMDETMHLVNGITSTFISDVGSAVATGSALNITDSFVDSDGNSIVQNSGGANDIHESSGIVSYIVSINDTLDNFTNQFIQLLSAPIVHIQQLISSGTNFFNAFGSLFSFLPTEVYQVVIGAFIVMVVIGVIKLLL